MVTPGTLAAYHYGGDLGCAFLGYIRTTPTKGERVEVTLGVLADAANLSIDGKLNILGEFNEMRSATFPFAWPSMQLVLKIEATTAEGAKHKFRLRVIDDDGNIVPGTRVVEGQIDLGKPYAAGHPHRSQVILGIAQARFEKPGTVEFEVAIDDKIVKTIPLYVSKVSPRPTG